MQTPIEVLIRKLRAHSDLTDQDCAALRTLRVNQRQAAAEEVIVKEGDEPRFSLLVLRGTVARYKVPSAGRQMVSLHMAGDMPDLQSLYLDTMDHSIGAIEDSELGFIPHADIRNLIKQHVNLAGVLWRDTLIDGAIFREWISNNSGRDAPTRLAHLLCELFLRAKAVGLDQGNSCHLPLTQTHLSEALGMSLVHVNRNVQLLRSKNLMELRNDTLTIYDFDALSALGDFEENYLNLRVPAAVPAGR